MVKLLSIEYRCVPVRAQVIILKLNKRKCDIRIRLTPCDYAVLRVHWKIGGRNHYFYPNGDCGGQFSSFINAIYCLYEEVNDHHLWLNRWNKDYKHTHPHNSANGMHTLQTLVKLDEERFGWSHVRFTRVCINSNATGKDVPDPIDIDIKSGLDTYHYTVDGKDLCYAVAKGCTEAIKKYGLRGYRQFTGDSYPGDSFDFDELLFLKAYALDVLYIRNTKEVWSHPCGWMRAEASSFADEMELLLFDM